MEDLSNLKNENWTWYIERLPACLPGHAPGGYGRAWQLENLSKLKMEIGHGTLRDCLLACLPACLPACPPARPPRWSWRGPPGVPPPVGSAAPRMCAPRSPSHQYFLAPGNHLEKRRTQFTNTRGLQLYACVKRLYILLVAIRWQPDYL